MTIGLLAAGLSPAQACTSSGSIRSVLGLHNHVGHINPGVILNGDPPCATYRSFEFAGTYASGTVKVGPSSGDTATYTGRLHAVMAQPAGRWFEFADGSHRDEKCTDAPGAAKIPGFTVAIHRAPRGTLRCTGSAVYSRVADVVRFEGGSGVNGTSLNCTVTQVGSPAETGSGKVTFVEQYLALADNPVNTFR